MFYKITQNKKDSLIPSDSVGVNRWLTYFVNRWERGVVATKFDLTFVDRIISISF